MKVKFLKSLKKFRGIGISLLKIHLSDWDGYGFSFLLVKIFMGGSCSERSLFFINVYPESSMGGKEIRIMGGIFFIYRKLWAKVIIPKKDRCAQCEDLCSSKEFYVGEIPFCSDECADY